MGTRRKISVLIVQVIVIVGKSPGEGRSSRSPTLQGMIVVSETEPEWSKVLQQMSVR